MCSIITGDFNARCSRWWKSDLTNVKGEEIDTLTSSAGYSQIIDKPTHILNNSKSCIDLIFRTNKNIISNYGVDVSIFEKCHHNIIFGKINIYIFFSIWVFFHEHSRFTGQQGKGEGIYLTPLYHFHPLHRHLAISRAITAESSPLHIAGSRTRTGNLWFPSASR